MRTHIDGERLVAWLVLGALVAGIVLWSIIDAVAGDDDASAGVATAADEEASSEPLAAAATAEASPAGPRSFTMAASGDILVHGSVAAAASPEGLENGDDYDFGPMFAEVQPILSAADLALCHLETPLSGDNGDTLSYFPVFNVPFQTADALVGAGYDGCSTASNHALDRGEAGVVETLDLLERFGLRSAGTARSAEEAARTELFDVAGVTVGHLSYTYGFNGGAVPGAPHLANVIDVDRILADAAAHEAAGAEFVIVSLQWGVEYQREPTPDQRLLAEQLLGADAIDLILGSHVHVVQPVEDIDGEYVVYGMGNFLSNQSAETCAPCPAGTQDGVIVGIQVSEQPDGSFAVDRLDVTPTWVDRSNGYVIRAIAPDTTDPTLAESRQRTLEALDLLGDLP